VLQQSSAVDDEDRLFYDSRFPLQLHRLAIMAFVGWRIRQIVHHYRRLLIVRFEAPRWMSITSRSDFPGSALWPSRSRIQARLLMRGELRLMPSIPPGVASEAPYCLSEIDFHSTSQHSPADTRIAVKA
jgi:hypothetical protein